MDDPLTTNASHTSVDEDVLRRVTAGDAVVAPPYSQFGTLVAKLRTLFHFLVDVARERGRTDHGAIARECGIHAARQGALLRIIGHHEAALGRPLLPAVVTGADDEMPGDDYFRLVERVADGPDDVSDAPAKKRWLWETQREKVYRTWTENTRSPRTDDRETLTLQTP